MEHIFDIKLARLYEEWTRSPEGILIDELSNELIMRILRPKKGESVLDIGCGTGNHLLFFHKLGLDITGIDASPYMLDIAKSRLGNKASLKLGRADNLPFEDNEFDISTLIITLEFIDNPLPVLREAGRVTKNKIFIGGLNQLSFRCIFRKCYALFHESIFRNIHLFTLWDLKKNVERAYGKMPLEWGSVHTMPFFFMEYARKFEESLFVQSSPFGSFLGLTVKIMYTVKTENIRIAETLKKGTESLAGISDF